MSKTAAPGSSDALIQQNFESSSLCFSKESFYAVGTEPYNKHTYMQANSWFGQFFTYFIFSSQILTLTHF
jgi:hypothetical protein